MILTAESQEKWPRSIKMLVVNTLWQIHLSWGTAVWALQLGWAIFSTFLHIMPITFAYQSTIFFNKPKSISVQFRVIAKTPCPFLLTILKLLFEENLFMCIKRSAITLFSDSIFTYWCFGGMENSRGKWILLDTFGEF